MNKVFTPIGLVLGLAAGQLAKKIFDKVWGLVRDEEAPRPKHREISLITLVLALDRRGRDRPRRARHGRPRHPPRLERS